MRSIYRNLIPAALVALAIGASPPVQAQTWSATNNTGFAVESNSANGKAFGGHFKYDPLTGEDAFDVVDGTDNSGTHVAGTTYTARDGATLGGSCKTVTLAQDDTLRATFANARQGTMQIGSGTPEALTRTEIASGYPAADAAVRYIQTGWYYDASCPGQGLHVEVMGGNVFGLIFFYDDTGRGRWAYFHGALTLASNGVASFTGDLNRCSRATGSTVCTSIGTLAATFPQNASVVATMPNGTSVTLTRFPIN